LGNISDSIHNRWVSEVVTNSEKHGGKHMSQSTEIETNRNVQVNIWKLIRLLQARTHFYIHA
jgi:hypothetical protein